MHGKPQDLIFNQVDHIGVRVSKIKAFTLVLAASHDAGPVPKDLP